MFVETKNIDTHGSPEPKTHKMDSDVSGNTLERAWCDECGCGIWMKNLSKTPDLTFMKAGESIFDTSGHNTCTNL